MLGKLCVETVQSFYLNGEELARVNMPNGRVSRDMLALQAIGSASEGMYVRLLVPLTAVHPKQENVLNCPV
jgi:hypothetical protein